MKNIFMWVHVPCLILSSDNEKKTKAVTKSRLTDNLNGYLEKDIKLI